MQATSISINIVGECNAHCPFCVSSVAWQTDRSDNRYLRLSLPKALHYARYHGVDTVSITGTGEPTLHHDLIFHIISQVRAAGIPIVELQTNGTLLAEYPKYLDELAQQGLTTIALSAASVDPAMNAQTMEIGLNYIAFISEVAKRGVLCRVSLNMIDHDRDKLLDGLGQYADTIYEAGARQLTLQALGVPASAEQNELTKKRASWIKEHALAEKDIQRLEKEIQRAGTLLRSLGYGPAVYDYHNLSVCMAPFIPEISPQDELRSLILMADGHVYHSWDYKGSILL
jgi:molybdenum cofactor biosynthesis enzyme MoaA